VFLNGEIKDKVLARRRRGKGTAKSRREKERQGKETPDAAAEKRGLKNVRGGKGGLGRFVKRKRSKN
jgi:hypothetical protein